MAILIPCATSIGILGIITLYQVYLNHLFIGSYKDKLYYFNAHLITLTTILVYTLMILNELFIGEINTINYFFSEWIITTALILINLGRLTDLNVNNYIYIIAFNELMVLSGYVSYITTNQTLSYVMYTIGCACFCIIMAFYLKKIQFLKKKNILQNSITISNSIRNRIFTGILYSIMCSWIFYPITVILLKTDSIHFQTAIDIIVVLDILTKGIFTNLLLGSKEIYQPRKSLLCCLTYTIFRIKPLEIGANPNSLEEITQVIQTAKKYDLRVVKVDTIIPNTITPYTSNIDNLDYTNSVKVVREESVEKILDYNPRQKGIKVFTSVSTLNSIAEELP
jgi:bacteriorhodopsin